MQKQRHPQKPPLRGPNRDVANYKIKEHAKMGGVYMYHANRWLTDPGSLQFLVDGECFGDNQTPSSLCLAGVARNSEIKTDCFLPQGGSCRAHRQRLSGSLPSGVKQPQRSPPPPEPPPRRASSSIGHHSYYSDNDGCFSKWSSSWSNKDSHYRRTTSAGRATASVTATPTAMAVVTATTTASASRKMYMSTGLFTHG